MSSIAAAGAFKLADLTVDRLGYGRRSSPATTFFFPKFAVVRGMDESRPFASGLRGAGPRLQRHRDRLNYVVSGQHSLVESLCAALSRRKSWRVALAIPRRLHMSIDPDTSSFNK